jgi:hypothetical protein
MTCCCIGGNPCPCQRRGAPWHFPTITPELQALLDAARARGSLTPKEIYEQKISWIQGMTGKLADPMRSREDVVKALADLGIEDPEPYDIQGSPK